VTEPPSSRTSVSDLAFFLDSVAAALGSALDFHRFKRLPGISTIEGVPSTEGDVYRKIALEQSPGLWRYIPKFLENDRFGSPRTVNYPEGPVSPTTWRYIKVLSDLQLLFGNLTDWDVAEIGAGYGGQFKIIQDVYALKSYTVYDLPIVAKLLHAYLNEIRCPARLIVQSADFSRLGTDPARIWDLVISNWAISECTREIQDKYIHHVLRRSRRGYITYNQISWQCGIDSYSVDEFCNALGFPVSTMPEGLNHSLPPSLAHRIVYWHHQPLLT